MQTTGKGLETFFAPPERAVPKDVRVISVELKSEFLVQWLDAIPASVLVINQYRQIVHCNQAFNKLSLSHGPDEVVGKRPGEALDCVNAHTVEAGCGCSEACATCGAAQAIVKSLNGVNDIQNCRLTRLVDGIEVPLDLQVFTTPIEYNGHPFIFLFAMDISHELRLRYMSRLFQHGLINTAGGIATVMELLESDLSDTSLYPLLVDSSRRILRDVVYYRDLETAEQGDLAIRKETFDPTEWLTRLREEECRIRNVQPSVVDVDASCDSVTSDKRVLGHVIRNMLVNALEAWEKAGGRVRLICRKDGDVTTFAVTNDGEVSDEIRKQMFKRYVSTKSRDRGLGTYVMKLLGEQYLGGMISYTSGEGKTTFSFSFL